MARCASAAARTAAAADGKAAKWASPSEPNGTPPSARTASSTSLDSTARSSPYAVSPMVATRFVEPSMSVNRNVTVPAGRAARRPPAGSGGDAAAGSAVETSLAPRSGGVTPAGSSGSGPVILGDLAQASGDHLEDGQRDPGLLAEHALEVPRRQREARRGRLCDDLGDARPAIEHRQLTEELPGSEARHGDPVADHPHLSLHDDEEAGADLTLPRDHA